MAEAHSISTMTPFGTIGKEVTPLTGGRKAESLHHAGHGCLTHLWFGGTFPDYGLTHIRVYVDGEAAASIDMEMLLGIGVGFQDDAAPWGIARLSNPLYDGRGYKVIGCRLGNTRSRGIIVKSDDGVIQNNVITHCGFGVAIGPEWPQEADYCHNVLVEGNTFSHNNDALSVNGAGAMQNRAITIRNNQFVSNRRRDIAIAWADGVTLQGNTFSALPAPAGVEPRSPVTVRDARNVAESNIRILTPAAYALPK